MEKTTHEKTTHETLNNVDLVQLSRTIDAVRDDPGMAEFTFRAKNEWLGGGRSRTRIQGFRGANQEDATRTEPFRMEGDEPEVLLGSNEAPNAVEAVLHALGSCLAVGFAYNAAARGIEVQSLEMDIEGELDLRGFLGLSEKVRPGYRNVRVRYTVDCEAPDGEVDDLCRHVQNTSPVLDILRNPVSVTVERS
jgi:uncharacterized OsmC-like protein